ncbi:hypothetical protein [Vibrio paucivorans]
MNYTVNQSWKILLPLSHLSPNYLHEHQLFQRQTGKSFLRKIGGGMDKFPISPEILRPTIVFDNEINKVARALGLKGKRMPYETANGTLNVNIHYYFEKYIVLDVVFKQRISFGDISLLQKSRLSSYPEIESLVLAIAGLIVSGNQQSYSPLTSIPTIRCFSIQSLDDNQFSNMELVEALTGHIEPTQRIIDDVLARNSGHQTSGPIITLIDKQGVIQFIPNKPKLTKDALQKYSSCCNLLELMLVIEQSIKDGHLDSNNVFLSALKSLVEKPEDIVKSYTAQRTIKQYSKDFHLESRLSDLTKKIELASSVLISEKKTLRRGWDEFYASNDFFQVLFTALVAGLVTGFGILWAFLKGL